MIQKEQMSLLNRLLLSLLLMVPRIEGFHLWSQHHHSSPPLTLLRAEAEGKPDGKQDLFDYFDPLLSPHAYPNGIDAGPSTTTSKESSSSTKPAVSAPLGFSTPAAAEPASVVEQQSADQEETNRQGDDLFDYFDPLLSPHAYPNGINAGATTQQPLEVVPSSSSSSSGGTHKKVGVLLMDHGSRNPASNTRLEKMAQLYQLTANFDVQDNQIIVVEPAHMEIASPSIVDGLKKLLDQGVDEIICHPYFLSPGRHVTEDIPQLLEDAKKELGIDDIRMVTTQPIGANTQLMIGAIHALVQEHSSILQNSSSGSSSPSSANQQ